jgi:hypothetical protein
VAGADTMSQHQAFRRTAVPQQVAQNLQTITIAAPTRGIILSENFTYMQPGGAMVLDNWVPTLRGVKLRGGCVRWCDLPETAPVISGFEYITHASSRMFAATQGTLYDVTVSGFPTTVMTGQGSGNYAASQLSNQGGDYLMAVNDEGDFPLRFDGTAWTKLNGGEINAIAGSAVEAGKNLVYVWKYRNRWFFIEKNSMNAWYLPLNAIQGTLLMIPLSGAATKGGTLLFGATWSIDAGDGTDDKCVFMTDQGEAIIFTGSDPSTADNWRQEGRYTVSVPMGMNAHIPIGGDMLIACVDGIIPLSQAITKTADQLELAAVSRPIKPMWRDMVVQRRQYPWTMKKWDEFGGVFVTWPGGPIGSQYTGCANSATGAWGRIVGWDAMCWMYLGGRLYFGTQDGLVMEADRGGYDDGKPYTATMVGGWEMFQQTSTTVVWHQARASFLSEGGQPFVPQLSACTDYIIRVPPPPPAGPDPGSPDVWDQGQWDAAKWDQYQGMLTQVVRNTGWVSIGETGFSHAPICQVTVAQAATPLVELISIGATFEKLGVNV